MEKWIIQNNKPKQALITWTGALVGLFLVYSLRGSIGGEFTTQYAGLLLGALLLIVCLGALAYLGDRIITVDPNLRQIEIKDKNRFKTTKKIFSFDQISSVGIREDKDTDRGMSSYDLFLSLRDGTHFSLLCQGYFDGRFDRSVREEQKQRLESYLKN